MLNKKTCIHCNKTKPPTEFNRNPKTKDRFRTECRNCQKESSLVYHRSKEGLVTKIYGHQKAKSKERGHQLPLYSKLELKEWIYSRSNFNLLYSNWVKSKYDKMLVPSVDRKNDYLGYTMTNIQLVTWQENKDKFHKDKRNGKNNKASRGVLQMTMSGKIIKKYHSYSEASRILGVDKGDIRKCCIGERKTVGGYRWENPI